MKENYTYHKIYHDLLKQYVEITNKEVIRLIEKNKIYLDDIYRSTELKFTIKYYKLKEKNKN